MQELGWTDLLNAYAYGIFPMAHSAEDEDLLWFEPTLRGLLPLDGFHVPARLRRTVRQGRFEVRVDTCFRDVILACASNSRPGRETTWISSRIVDLYTQLHERGFAHSVESWQDGRLAGGVYGVSIGGAFFGESMFSFATDASKVALVHLVARLRAGGYMLLDTQWTTEHLSQFGAFEVPKAQYRRLLEAAIRVPARFEALPADATPSDVLRWVDHGNKESS